MKKANRNAGSKLDAQDQWRVEADLATLLEAEKIKADPKRYAKVQALAKQKMMETAKVASSDDE